MTTEGLQALDREWAELAGWTYEPKGWRDPDGDLTYYTKRFSSRPDHCFGPGGPWVWMVEAMLEPTLDTTYYDGLPLFAVETYRNGTETGWHSGDTPFEAITRCAIEARKSTGEAAR